MKKCPYEEKIDLYLRGKLSETESAQFEEHYFSCPPCFQKTSERNELIEVIQRRGAFIFDPAASRRPEPRISLGEKVAAFLTPRRWVTAAVTAALLLVVALAVAPRFKSHGPDFVFTGDETVRGESLAVLSPRGDVKAVPDSFEWKALNAAAEYQVTLSGLETLWTTTTQETKIALPEDLKNKLKAGSYTWQVKAYSAQGTLLAASPKVLFKILN